jgi:TonB family protein
MHRTISALVVLILAGNLAAQTRPIAAKVVAVIPSDFQFPGGVLLRVGIDSMTDQQTCAIFVTSDSVWIDTAGAREALITTGADVDYSRPALLRIGSAPAFALIVHREPRRILIPPAKAAAVIRALYAQRRVHLRYSEWPSGGLFDEEVRFGDFAAAYDRGVQLCAWPRLHVPAVHPIEKAEPTVPGATASDAAAVQDLQWYLAAIESRVRANWNTSALAVNVRDARAARCVVSFIVASDGSVKGIRVSQSSGDLSVDNSAQRAVLSSTPMPALPPDRQQPLVLRMEFDSASSSLKISM